MVQAFCIPDQVAQWLPICAVTDIQPNTGVNALVGTHQVAIFRIGSTDEVYAISNFDPFSKAFVLSRGIIGDRKGLLKVASPIYKQNFDLKTGVCLDDETVSVCTFPVQVVNGQVQVGLIV